MSLIIAIVAVLAVMAAWALASRNTLASLATRRGPDPQRFEVGKRAYVVLTAEEYAALWQARERAGQYEDTFGELPGEVVVGDGED